MSNDSNFLKTTMDLIETDAEIKSFIYQQIADFNPYVTPDTTILVIARDPSQVDDEAAIDREDDDHEYKYRIAIILKDEDASIEAEAYHDDIFEAIKMAKEALLSRLAEIQEEMETPQERANAIQQASNNEQVH